MDSFFDDELYDILLKDRSSDKSIVWSAEDEKQSFITVCDAKRINPKNKETKTDILKRAKNKAEVYTPSYICKIQNDFIDEFGLKEHSFWQDYVLLKNLEITLGEAPYLTNRYDAVTGKYINPYDRAGLLDRKLKIICDNVQNEIEWISWAEKAVKSIYGYDIQGENVYLARKNIILGVNEFFHSKYNKNLEKETLINFANILSWNVWQADGLSKKSNTKIKDWEKNKLIKFTSLINKKENFFYGIVGNPPYQGKNHQQIYTDFYLISKKIGNVVSLIFPAGWQEPKNANNLYKMNNKSVKKDKQIVLIDNRRNVFSYIQAEWTNIIVWKRGYNNNLNGKQIVYTNGENPIITEFLIKHETNKKPKEILLLAKCISRSQNFESISKITSSRKPYGLGTKVENISKIKKNTCDIKLYSNKWLGSVGWVPSNYEFPIKSLALNKYKVFVPYAWGNLYEKHYLCGTFADIIIAFPNESCTETYLESGCFEDYETAKKHAKYLMTKFARALLYVNKTSQHSTTAWGAIPIQDYSEKWWDKSIEDIDKELMKKYNVPENIQEFIYNNFQTKTEKNITNYKE